jgi:hypothetical protein
MLLDQLPPSKLDLGEDEIPNLPRATELLMKLRYSDQGPPRRVWILCLIYLAAAASSLIFMGAKAWPQTGIWLGLTVLTLFAEKWVQQQRREKIVLELLGELVAENNRLNRLVAESPNSQK